MSEIDLDAMFDAVAPSTNDKKTNNNRRPKIASFPPGAFVKITFKPDSIMALALQHSPFMSNEGTNVQDLAGIKISPKDVYGIVIYHSPKSHAIQFRLYDMSKPYNTQTQSMMTINLDEIEKLEFIAMVQASTKVESLSQDALLARIAYAQERREKQKLIINPRVDRYAQELALHLARTMQTCFWADDKTFVVENNSCVVYPFTKNDTYEWNGHKKSTTPASDFLQIQVSMFEVEWKSRPIELQYTPAQLAEQERIRIEKEKKAAELAEKQKEEEKIKNKFFSGPGWGAKVNTTTTNTTNNNNKDDNGFLNRAVNNNNNNNNNTNNNNDTSNNNQTKEHKQNNRDGQQNNNKNGQHNNKNYNNNNKDYQDKRQYGDKSNQNQHFNKDGNKSHHNNNNNNNNNNRDRNNNNNNNNDGNRSFNRNNNRNQQPSSKKDEDGFSKVRY